MTRLRKFSPGELDRMRDLQTSAMQDTCRIWRRVEVTGADGGLTHRFIPDSDPVVCGVRMTSGSVQQGADWQAPRYDGQVRLPLEISVKTFDQIEVLTRFGAPVAESIRYNVAGPALPGPSGKVVYIQRVAATEEW